MKSYPSDVGQAYLNMTSAMPGISDGLSDQIIAFLVNRKIERRLGVGTFIEFFMSTYLSKHVPISAKR